MISEKICKRCALPNKKYRTIVYKKAERYKNKPYQHESLICEDCRKELMRIYYAKTADVRRRRKSDLWKTNRDVMMKRSKANMKKAKEELSDSYIRNRLRIKKEDASPGLIEAKRLLYILKRKIRDRVRA